MCLSDWPISVLIKTVYVQLFMVWEARKKVSSLSQQWSSLLKVSLGCSFLSTWDSRVEGSRTSHALVQVLMFLCLLRKREFLNQFQISHRKKLLAELLVEFWNLWEEDLPVC